jgi:hypothetical protein
MSAKKTTEAKAFSKKTTTKKASNKKIQPQTNKQQALNYYP